jgi:hypothetical protein
MISGTATRRRDRANVNDHEERIHHGRSDTAADSVSGAATAGTEAADPDAGAPSGSAARSATGAAADPAAGAAAAADPGKTAGSAAREAGP